MGLPCTWTTACPDWENRIVAGESLIALPPLFPVAGDQGLAYLHDLTARDVGDGTMTFGQLCRPWINDFVRSIFGACDPQTGIRHITEFFLLISKKNAKSTIAAAIMLTALLLNWRPDAEYIILAPTKEVADNSFKPAASMIRADPELEELLIVQDHLRTITHIETGATLKVVAADSGTVAGKKATGVLIDELHEFGKMPNAESMLVEATGGLASRDEGFIIYLSTQSDTPPAGVFKKKLEYARRVRDGLVNDPRFLPVLYEFPQAMLESQAYLDPKNYYVTNPNMGASVSESFLIRKLQVAGEDGEDSLQGVLAKHLNVEIGLNLRQDRWPGANYWLKKVEKRLVSLEYLIERSEVITVGIDGGGLDDLLGLAVLGRDYETGEWLLWTKAWGNPSVKQYRKDIVTTLEGFEKAGEFVFVQNFGDDTAEVAAVCHQVKESGLLHKVGMDPNAIGTLLDDLEEVGIILDPEDAERNEIVSVNQGYRLAGAIKTCETKVSKGEFLHGGTGLMNWCVGNAKVKVVGNAIVVTKQVSGKAKIDPLMAVFNAVALMQNNPPSKRVRFDFSDMLIAG